MQEVFRVATQKVRPDPGLLERQQEQQRRHTTWRRAAPMLAAALVAAIAVLAVRAAVDSSEPKDVGDPADQVDAHRPGPGTRRHRHV